MKKSPQIFFKFPVNLRREKRWCKDREPDSRDHDMGKDPALLVVGKFIRTGNAPLGDDFKDPSGRFVVHEDSSES
jgi:hypothetical protein